MVTSFSSKSKVAAMCIQVKKQQLELDTEQWTGSKLGKAVKAVYCHPASLTYMQSNLCEILVSLAND